MHPSRPVFDREDFSQPADVLNIVLDHISQSMVVIGSDSRTLAFNQHFEEMFRLPPETMEVGVDFRDILRVWTYETGQDDAMLEQAIRGEMRSSRLSRGSVPRSASR